MTVLATGGAGFIGANFVLDWLARSDETDARHLFVHGGIGDGALVAQYRA
jgi:dTDP-glucose 4,6-dehydratase